jgi:hypothetical protein
MERTITIRFGPLSFQDSCAHMKGTLGDQVGKLWKQSGLAGFERTQRHHPWKHMSEDVIQKPDHPPYRRLGQWDVPLSALTKEDYYNDLKERPMSDEGFVEKRQWHAKLGLRTVGDEHDAYLASDVLTLADAWMSWRRTSYEILGLDPAWSLTLPTLAYKSLSRFAEGKVELFTEADAKINDRLNKSMIGGICVPFQRVHNF